MQILAFAQIPGEPGSRLSSELYSLLINLKGRPPAEGTDEQRICLKNKKKTKTSWPAHPQPMILENLVFLAILN